MGLRLDLTSGSLPPQQATCSLLYLNLYLPVYFSDCADGFSERADDSSERAGDSSESAGDSGKDYKGFLREHVRLYPKFVRQWGVSGCQRSSEWVLLVMNSKGWDGNLGLVAWKPPEFQFRNRVWRCDH